MTDYSTMLTVSEEIGQDGWIETATDATSTAVPDVPASNDNVTIDDVYASPIAPLPFANANFRVPAPAVMDAPPSSPRTLDYSWQQPLNRQVADWMSLFVDDGQVVELRALKVEQTNGAKLTWSGFYSADKLDRMANDAMELTGDAEGTYFTLNPLNRDLLARRYNRGEVVKEGEAVPDKDVLKRRWLLIDPDPVRLARISSTDQEKQQAWQFIREVHAWLQQQGWPEPILCDSGNSYHLLYRIDLPCDDGGLVQGVLKALANRFDNAQVKIDTGVFNPARICKLYGSLARKGDSVRARPHRRTGVLNMPAEMVVVTKEQLEQVRGDVPQAVVQVPAGSTQASVVVPPNTLAAGSRADAISRARSYLAKVPGAIEGQKGSNQTFKAACILVRFGLSDDDAMVLLREWNQKCEPPWVEKDLKKKLRDARVKVGSARMPQRLDGSTPTGTREAVDDPHRLAKLYLGSSQVDGLNTLVFWAGNWYQWNGTCYEIVAEPEIRNSMTRSIKAEFDQINRIQLSTPATTEGSEQVRLPSVRKVTTKLLTDAMQALRSECFVSGTNAPPCWLDDDGPVPAEEVLVARNGMVHVPSLLEGNATLQTLTPNLFSVVGLDYDIDPNAPEPKTWLEFLRELCPNDPESINLMQEWFGYNVTLDTRQQKMLLVVGPKRSGKGTIGRVLAGLVGQANVVGATLSSLSGEFGLSPLINKPVAILADARFAGRLKDQAVVVERLLSVSGEDLQSINRKNSSYLTTKLPTRFTILTNELPGLIDASAALPSRLLTLPLTRSWYGEEDTTLTERLLKERAGILNWAIEGLKRLRQRGRFVQPESGADMIRRLIELSSPVTAFVQERCELGKDRTVAKNMLFMEWRSWCNDCGHEPGNQATFGKNLVAAYPEVQRVRPRDGASRVQTYQGLSIRRL